MRVQDLHPSTGKGRAALAGWDGNVGDPPPGHGGRGGIQGAAQGKNHTIWEHAPIKYIKPFLSTDALTRRSDCATGTRRDTRNKLPNCSSASLVAPGFAPQLSMSWRWICSHMSASRLCTAPASPGKAAWAVCVCWGEVSPCKENTGQVHVLGTEPFRINNLKEFDLAQFFDRCKQAKSMLGWND